MTWCVLLKSSLMNTLNHWEQLYCNTHYLLHNQQVCFVWNVTLNLKPWSVMAFREVLTICQTIHPRNSIEFSKTEIIFLICENEKGGKVIYRTFQLLRVHSLEVFFFLFRIQTTIIIDYLSLNHLVFFY